MNPDTIVALATPPGVSALAVVRMSGSEAISIVSRLASVEPSSWESRRATVAKLVEPREGRPLDQAVVTVFRGPGSYTGEDLVEISTHGGFLTPAAVVESCVWCGAREADPGEFTRRAYLHGKLDLTQAEAVLDLTQGVAPKARDVAIHQLERGLASRIAELRERLVGVAALLTQHIDFPEEDDAPTSLSVIGGEADEVAGAIRALLSTAPSGELLREGALTVLAGRPNSGKSSLFNAMLGYERAIVTEEAGTTRDALEATVSLEGFPFRLVDTAGLREEAGRVERMGIEVAHRYLAGADVVLYCVEAGRELGEDEIAFCSALEAPVLIVRTKADVESTVVCEPGGPEDGVAVSAVTGRGLHELNLRLAELVFGGVVENRTTVPVVTRERQAALLRTAAEEVEAFVEALASEVPPEVAGTHLGSAQSALEDIVGIVHTDDVLDRVFRDFCIGK